MEGVPDPLDVFNPPLPAVSADELAATMDALAPRMLAPLPTPAIAPGSAGADLGGAPPHPHAVDAPAAGAGAAGTAAPAAPAGPVFVTLEEKREESGMKPAKSRGHGQHTYTIRFYLVDSTGMRHLAATGVDMGDSHYQYTNQTGFPALMAANKGDVKSWAEQIMQASQERAGYYTDVVQDEVPADASTLQLPTFVGYKEEKEDLPDGRHRIRWILLDTQGHGHLALTGEEKETRDGHYVYHTETIFNYAAPLEVGNQEAVHQWLDAMIVHPGEVRPAAAGKLLQRPLAAVAHRGPGRPPRPGSARGGSKHHGDALLRQATANLAKRARGWRGFDPNQEARDLIVAELRRWGQEEAVEREAAKRAALAYALEPLGEAQSEVLGRCLPVLQAAAATAAPPASSPTRSACGGANAQQRSVVATLGALREVAHIYAPLSVVAAPGVKSAVAALTAHEHPEVAALARGVLSQWLRTAVAEVAVLSNARYVCDPRPLLEDLLADRERLDPIVAAVTHRNMQADPQAGAALPPAMLTAPFSALRTPFAHGISKQVHFPDVTPGAQGASPAAVADKHPPPPQQQQQQQDEDGGAGGDRLHLDDRSGSQALLDAPMDVQDDDVQILPPFQQQMAQAGVQF